MPADTYTTHNDQQSLVERVNGTCFCGTIAAEYDELVALFGPPVDTEGDKIDAYWVILFDLGVLATVYNYKDGRSYLGPRGLDPERIRLWHVGGFHQTPPEVALIEATLRDYRAQKGDSPCQTSEPS